MSLRHLARVSTLTCQWNMYRSLASETSVLTAEIYKEIRRCLRLRGGTTVDGVKWIWKTAKELGQLFGVNEKTCRRHLKRLVDLGWLVRLQWEKHWGKRAYFYTLGDQAPLKNGTITQPDQQEQKARSNADIKPASYNQHSTVNNSLPARTAKTADSPKRKEAIPPPVPEEWPQLSMELIKEGIKKARNQAPLLRKPRSAAGFG